MVLTGSTAPAIEARDITVFAGDRTLLAGVSLAIAPGELVALIGPSGAGKTTLLRVLSGSARVSGGTVSLGEGLRDRRNGGVGYVPSEDLLHDQLTVSEELFYAAALRGPTEANADDVEQVVAATLADFQLSELSEQPVKLLSKGERRRTSCAVEFVGRPDVLLLDEPGSGLDAGLERRLMRLLRGLADQGRAVLAATHATASLRMCDRVAVMGRGGALVFVGTLDDVLAHFGVDSVEAVYEALEDVPAPAVPPADAVRDAVPHPADSTAAAAPAPWFGRQLVITTERAAICRLRDVRAFAILVGQAPIIGLAIGLVLPRGSLSDPNLGPYYGVLMSFILVVASLWLGLIAACRDVVGEIGIVRRELAIGLRTDAYLLSRCLTLFPVVMVQTTLMSVIVVVLQRPPHGGGWIIIACLVTGVASACQGLWLSAWARTPDIAVTSTPLLLIPQMLLAGALIPLSAMLAPLRVIADVVIGRWSFDALGSGLGLGQSLGSNLSSITGLAPTSFASSPAGPIVGMVVIGLLALVAAGVTLGRRVSR